MQTASRIDPAVAAHLMRRYPLTDKGLASMWAVSCAWLEEHVRIVSPRPAVFDAAALLHLQSCCTQSAVDRAALRFAAFEMIAPYARR